MRSRRATLGLVSLALAFLVACEEPSTSIELSVMASPALGIDGLTLKTNDQRVEHPMMDAVTLKVPDHWSGIAQRIDVEGTHLGATVAKGAVVVTPIAGQEVSASVTLVDVSCPLTCNVGEARCATDGVTACSLDAGGCPSWTAPIACPAAMPFCSNGECSESCEDECTPGSTRCDGTGDVQTCGNTDGDPCLDWGPPGDCPGSEVCAVDRCTAAHALTVVRTGDGAVTSSPPGIACGADCSETFAAGTQVTLTATPATGATFSGWNGGGCAGTGTCVVTLSAMTQVTAAFSGQSCVTTPWSKARIDVGADAQIDVAIAPDGTVHAVYVADTAVKHAARAPGQPWSGDVIHQDFLLQAEPAAPSIAVSPTGTLYAAYNAVSQKLPGYRGIFVASDLGGQWGAMALGTSLEANPGTTISVDTSDRVHVAFQKVSDPGGSSSELSYVEGQGGVWSGEATLDAGNGWFPAMASSPDGATHVVYRSESPAGSLAYRKNPTGTAWGSPRTVTGGSPTSTGLAIDTAGVAHVAYRVPAAGVWYAAGTAAGFTSRVISGTATTVDIAVTPGGAPHVAYFDGGNLYHGWLQGGTWMRELIDDAAGLAGGSWGTVAIARAHDGTLHVVYANTNAGEIWYASGCRP